MNSIEINTSQNVNLNFELASIGERILAFAVDMLIKVAYLITFWLVFIRWGKFLNYIDTLDQWSIIAIWSIVLLPINVYTLVFESLMEGQTPGKKILKIKVIKTDAYQANFGDYLARWVFRLIDILVSTGLVGVMAIIINKENKRLGDMVAGTSVISLKSKFNINHTILVDLEEDYMPKFPQVVALTDNDMRIIKENYIMATRNKDADILTKLTDKICESAQISFDEKKLSPAQFIEVVIKDYNYYTGKS